MACRSIEAFRALIEPPAAIVATSDFSEAGPLSVAERDYISSAIESRRKDFATGRRCAVEALAAIGVDVASIGRSGGRQPTWPEGAIGSITHCAGLCAAAAASTANVRFLGIDAEPNEPLKDKLLERVSHERERVLLASVPGTGFTGKTLFSAKESIFKALYREVGEYFGFEEVEICNISSRGTFEAALSPMLQAHVKLDCLAGRFSTTDEHTLTAVQLNWGST